MYKRLAIITTIIATLSLFVGCGSSDISNSDYKNLKQESTLGIGYTTVELQNLMLDFVNKVYSPQSQDDIDEGLKLLEGITTESEMNNLRQMANKYDESKNGVVSSVQAYFGDEGKSTKGSFQRVFIVYTMESSKIKQTNGIEFVINGEDKIFKHYLWQGQLSANK